LRNLGIEITEEEKEMIMLNVPTESLEAFLAYSRGLNYADKGMYKESAKEFENAISIDPAFGQAMDALEGAKLLSQPVENIGSLEFAWSSALAADRGKSLLLQTTLNSIAPGDVNRIPVSDVQPGPQEVELEVLIQW